MRQKSQKEKSGKNSWNTFKLINKKTTEYNSKKKTFENELSLNHIRRKYSVKKFKRHFKQIRFCTQMKSIATKIKI